jgi:hypothetical protein
VTLGIGDTVAGRYVLMERLGAGGMGVVYLADDTTLGRDVALKVLLPHVSNDDALLQRFRREARVLAQLRNPGITTVHDLVVTDDGSTALILEYVAGGSLDGRIEAGPLPWRTVAQIGVAAAEALAEAHGAGIVHRDIKPSNILLETDGGVRVADFGIAQVAGEASMTMQGEAIGTPAYMSPEQAAGTEVGPASDIYSLGACLFAAVTGGTPFATEEGGLAAAVAHITQPVPDPRAVQPAVPDAAAEVLMRAMAKSPAQRYSSAAEFAAALRASAGLSTGDIPVAQPFAAASDGPATIDPALAHSPAAPMPSDATYLGSASPLHAPMPLLPETTPVPATTPAPAPKASLNAVVAIGAAVALIVVAVLVVVTVMLTGGSDTSTPSGDVVPAQAQPDTPALSGDSVELSWELGLCMSSADRQVMTVVWENDSWDKVMVTVTAASRGGERYEWSDVVRGGSSFSYFRGDDADKSPTSSQGREFDCDSPNFIEVAIVR